MPIISRKAPCRNRRCGALVPGGGYCAACVDIKNAERQKEYRRASLTRVKTSAAGYGSTWQRASIYQRRKEPLCRLCLEVGRLTVAECVDHIIPKSQGGTDAPDNLQSLCWSCHSIKTRREN